MANAEDLLKTPLHDLHVEYGGKMVPFAGYAMPVQFPLGVLGEHKHTRASAGLFDVSHMGQVRLVGNGAAAALETLVPADVQGLAPGQMRYSQFTNDQGGILDDLMITNRGSDLLLVVNAACKEQDIAHLQTHLGDKIAVEPLPTRGLVALQGPQAAQVLSALAPQAADLVFMSAAPMQVAGADCYVSRSGYTGEDGFEISMPEDAAETVARALLADERVLPIGLGARDSLRLEAGLCLYGHDIDETTSPVEAGLTWSIPKHRRTSGGYPGADTVERHLIEGVARRRVGILPDGRAPAREGAEIVNENGNPIGTVTSGGFGPSADRPVAMGYVASAFAKAGTAIGLQVRGRTLPAHVAKLPFVPQRYFRG